MEQNERYGHVSAKERDLIAVLHAGGASLAQIAARVNRDRSTISRELRRNGSPGSHHYFSTAAQLRAHQRWLASHQRERVPDAKLRRWIVHKIKRGWSPEQISGWLHRMHPDHAVSHEAIYQFVYDPKYRHQEDLVPYLTRHHKKRFPRTHWHRHRKLHIPARVPIGRRPPRVADRRQAGNWEADTILGQRHKHSLAIAVERTSRYIRLRKLPARTAYQNHLALVRSLSHYPRALRRTITYDNGFENTEHQRTNAVLGTKSYFCRPFCSHDKPTVENTIGLVRRVIPKGTDFGTLTRQDIKRLEYQLNTRPRKTLGFKTPSDVFHQRVGLAR
jgi:IS30 family transposase